MGGANDGEYFMRQTSQFQHLVTRSTALGLVFLFVLGLLVTPAPRVFAAPCPDPGTYCDDTADLVLGQVNAVTNSINQGFSTPWSDSLYSPTGVAVNSTGVTYVADRDNNRVLAWDPTATGYPGPRNPLLSGTLANRVYGQGNTNAFDSNAPGTSATSLRQPQGVAVDARGNLYVADTGNRRVVMFPAPTPGALPDWTATRLIGPADFSTTSFSSLNAPQAVVLDSLGNLFVADALPGSGGNVYLYRNFANTTGSNPVANLVITGLNAPSALAVDSANNLYIADAGTTVDTSRVLIYRIPTSGTTPTLLATITASANPATTPGALPLLTPRGVAVDALGNLYVSDSGRHRLLVYANPLTTDLFADMVLGQANFTSGSQNRGNNTIASATSLWSPFGLAVDAQRNLYVADTGNHRVMGYDIPMPNPKPAINAINPPDATMDLAGTLTTPLNLTINGSNFINGARFFWGDPSVEYVPGVLSTQLMTATIPVTELQPPLLARTVPITVTNPLPLRQLADGISNVYNYIIYNPKPTITTTNGLVPASTPAGNAVFLTINGTNFVNGARVLLNGESLPPEIPVSFISSTQLSLVLPADRVATPGTINVQVVNPGSPLPDGTLPPNFNWSRVTSEPSVFQVVNPAPNAISLSPNAAIAGDPAFEMIVNGTNFVASSVVRWNGANLTTTFSSTTQLRVAVPANLVANAGTANVTVFTPGPGGGESAPPLVFTINVSNAPIIIRLNPDSALVGQSGFLLTVSGRNFNSGSRVHWNGEPRITFFDAGTGALLAAISAEDLLSARVAQVTVVDPTLGTSAPQPFSINNPRPSLFSVVPAAVSAGAPETTVTLNGAGFVSTSVVRWNDAPLTTTFISANQLSVRVPAANLVNPSTVFVTVFNPTPGGGVSDPLSFTIGGADSLLITNIMPTSVQVGATGFTLTVNGQNFGSGAQIRWTPSSGGQTNLTTTFVSSSRLTAQIPASLLATAGTVSISVANPNGAVSNTVQLTISAASPRYSVYVPLVSRR